VISTQPIRSFAVFMALAAHNVEEAIFAPRWVATHTAQLRPYVGDAAIATWAGAPFRFSLAGLTAALLVLAWAAARAPREGFAVYLLLAVLAVFAANAVVPHIVAAVVLGGYVPGVVTASAIVLPLTVWCYASTTRDRYATVRGAIMAGVIGVAAYAVLVGALLAARGTSPDTSLQRTAGPGPAAAELMIR